jgi:hypothetical protein
VLTLSPTVPQPPRMFSRMMVASFILFLRSFCRVPFLETLFHCAGRARPWRRGVDRNLGDQNLREAHVLSPALFTDQAGPPQRSGGTSTDAPRKLGALPGPVLLVKLDDPIESYPVSLPKYINRNLVLKGALHRIARRRTR